jgi:hypothetical protein
MWATSNRRAELPPNWGYLRAVVLSRDHHRCRWVVNGVRCMRHATDVDHIGNKHDHRLGNLQALCVPHHRHKTALQGNAARWRYRMRRDPEPHPGLVHGASHR